MKGTLIHIISALGLCLITQTIFHEIGHFIGGVISGWKLLYIQIYKLALKRNTKTNKFNIVWVDELSYQCIMYPSSLETDAFLYTLGGCITNLFTGLIGIIILIITRPTRILWIYMWCFSIYGVGFFLMNSIADVRRVCNDGACFRFLKSSYQTKVCHNAQMLLAKKLMEGLSYRQIGKELIYLCPTVAGNDIEVYQAILEYYYYLDVSNYIGAKKSLNKIKEIKNISGQILKVLKKEKTYEKIIIALNSNNYLDNIEFDDIANEKLSYKHVDVHSVRVKMAVEAYKKLNEGNVLEAVKLIDDSLKYISSLKLIYESEKVFNLGQLKKLKMLIEKKVSNTEKNVNTY